MKDIESNSFYGKIEVLSKKMVSGISQISKGLAYLGGALDFKNLSKKNARVYIEGEADRIEVDNDSYIKEMFELNDKALPHNNISKTKISSKKELFTKTTAERFFSNIRSIVAVSLESCNISSGCNLTPDSSPTSSIKSKSSSINKR